MTRIKICGLTRREDAMLAAELGAHALGFIFEPSSPRFLSEVPDWIDEIPPFVSRVAVFGMAPAAFIERSFHVIQGMAESFVSSEKDGFQRIAALRVKPEDTLEGILARIPDSDALLLDAHVEGQYGGTGRRLDWDLAADVVRASPLPVILAGGLTPENVAEAIRTVRPYAVDVASGVESAPGVKDPDLLRTFIQAARI